MNIDPFDVLRLKRQYLDILEKVNQITDTNYKDFLLLEASIFLQDKNLEKEISLLKINDYIKEKNIDLEKNFDHLSIELILEQIFINEENNDSDDFLTKLASLPKIKQIFQYNNFITKLECQPFRSRIFLEMYLKKYLNDKSSLDLLEEMKIWQSIFIEENLKLRNLKNILGNEFFILNQNDKRLYEIWICKLINVLISNPEKENLTNLEIIKTLFELFEKQQVIEIVSNKIIICILYVIAKQVLPYLFISNQNEKKYFSEIKKKLEYLLNFFQKQGNPVKLFDINTFEDIFIVLFTGIDFILDKKYKKYIKGVDTNEIQRKLKEDIHINNIIFDKLSGYSAINFKRNVLLVQKKIKDILSHKLVSLVKIYSEKRKDNTLVSTFFERYFTLPFDDDVFLMKLGFHLFFKKDYNRCYQIIKTAIESDSIKNHKFRACVISLIVVLCAKYYGRNVEALFYSKLNLNSYLNFLGKEFPLKLEGIYFNIGLCYYNSAKNSCFYTERIQTYLKALEYFEISYKSNVENYLVCYYIGKIYAILNDIENAIIFVKKAIALNRRNMLCLVLLALLFTAKNEFKKANFIIDELIFEYPNKILLYIFKAYLEGNHLLIQYYKSNEDTIFPTTSPNLPKIELKNILEKLQIAFSIALTGKYKIKYSANFFEELPSINTLNDEKIAVESQISFYNVLLYSLDLLAKLNLTDIFSSLIPFLNDNTLEPNMKNYYLGILNEIQGKTDEAINIFEKILVDEPIHFNSALELSLTAVRLDENSQILYCLGYILSERNEIEKSNEYLTKALELNHKSPLLPYTILPEALFEY